MSAVAPVLPAARRTSAAPGRLLVRYGLFVLLALLALGFAVLIQVRGREKGAVG